MRWIYLCALILGFRITSEALEVQGHRGAGSAFPENSLPAVEAAVKGGIDVLELDLQMTCDGVLIIHHDYHLNQNLCRGLNGRALESGQLIRDLSLHEIKQCDCGLSQSEDEIRVKIPTLEELLQMIQGSLHPHAQAVRLNLELKRDPRQPEWSASPEVLAEAVVKLVEKYGFSSRVYYSSFDPQCLAAIRAAAPNASLALLFSEESLKEAAKIDPSGGKQLLLKIAKNLSAGVLSPEHVLLKSSDDVKFFQEQGFRVVTWTVNDQSRWTELSEMGIDGIITDRPFQLLEYLKVKP